MILIVIILIIVIIVKNRDYYKREEELLKRIRKLQSELDVYKEMTKKEIINQDDEFEIVEKENDVKTSNIALEKETNPVSTTIVEEVEEVENLETIKEEKQENNTKAEVYTSKVENDEGIKNKFILMTGASLIILAAVIFLTSTWHTIPNLLKTIVIMLLGGVFLGASNIAKKTFKLEETANTFLYMALAYLPISLFSISYFGLLGNYLSVHGEGKNLYLFIVSFIVSIIYYKVGDNKNNKVLFNASMIMQLICVSYISRCIKNEFTSVVLGIIIYNIILTISKKKIFGKYLKIVDVYNNICLYSIFAIEAIYIIAKENMPILVITNMLLLANLYIKKKEKNTYLNNTLLLTSIFILVLSALNLVEDLFATTLRGLLIYITIIAVYINGFLYKNDKFKESSFLVSLIAMIILYFSAHVSNYDLFIIKDFMILWAVTIMNIFGYIALSNRRKIIIHLIPIGLFLAGIRTIQANDLNINYLLLISVATFLLSSFRIVRDKEDNQVFSIYTNLMIIVSAIICMIADFNGFLNNIPAFVLLLASYTISYIRNKDNEIYKVVSYLLTNMVLYSIMHKLNISEYANYIFFITTMMVIGIEICFKSLKDNFGNLYIIFSLIMTFITLNIKINIITFILLLLSCLTYYIISNKTNIDRKTNIIPFIALIPSVYISKWAVVDSFNYMIIMNIILIGLTTYLSIYDKKINVYTFISAIYIIMQSIFFHLNVYINLAMGLLWSTIHLIAIPEGKAGFEFIAYTLGLALYNNIVGDLKISLTSIKYLGFIVYCILISRTILKKYMEESYKALEYIAFSIIYIVALFNYTNQVDGMMFVFMIVLITIISYIVKFGPVFFTSIVAILVNAFLLTDDFWFSIPWWIYILLIGTLLIVFAIKNEMNENSQKGSMKEKMRNIKDYLDM